MSMTERYLAAADRYEAQARELLRRGGDTYARQRNERRATALIQQAIEFRNQVARAEQESDDAP